MSFVFISYAPFSFPENVLKVLQKWFKNVNRDAFDCIQKQQRTGSIIMSYNNFLAAINNSLLLTAFVCTPL